MGQHLANLGWQPFGKGAAVVERNGQLHPMGCRLPTPSPGGSTSPGDDPMLLVCSWQWIGRVYVVATWHLGFPSLPSDNSVDVNGTVVLSGVDLH